MKLTNKQLKQIIKEEMKNVLYEDLQDNFEDTYQQFVRNAYLLGKVLQQLGEADVRSRDGNTYKYKAFIPGYKGYLDNMMRTIRDLKKNYEKAFNLTGVRKDNLKAMYADVATGKRDPLNGSVLRAFISAFLQRWSNVRFTQDKLLKATQAFDNERFGGMAKHMPKSAKFKDDMEKFIKQVYALFKVTPSFFLKGFIAFISKNPTAGDFANEEYSNEFQQEIMGYI